MSTSNVPSTSRTGTGRQEMSGRPSAAATRSDQTVRRSPATMPRAPRSRKCGVWARRRRQGREGEWSERRRLLALGHAVCRGKGGARHGGIKHTVPKKKSLMRVAATGWAVVYELTVEASRYWLAYVWRGRAAPWGNMGRTAHASPRAAHHERVSEYGGAHYPVGKCGPGSERDGPCIRLARVDERSARHFSGGDNVGPGGDGERRVLLEQRLHRDLRAAGSASRTVSGCGGSRSGGGSV